MVSVSRSSGIPTKRGMPMNRKAIVATALAVTLAGAGATAAELIGPAHAQESGTTQTQTQTPDQAPDKNPPSFVTDALSKLVTDGTITQAQADAVAQALAAARPPDGGGPRSGHGPGLSAAAAAIGIDESTLAGELSSAKSIAQVASDHGVDVQAVIDAMVVDAQAHLAQDVADGRITQDQADQKAADLTTRVTAVVNGQMPAAPPGGGHGRGPGGPPPSSSGSPGSTSSGSTSSGSTSTGSA